MPTAPTKWDLKPNWYHQKVFEAALVASGATQGAIDFTVVLPTAAVEKTIGILNVFQEGAFKGYEGVVITCTEIK